MHRSKGTPFHQSCFHALSKIEANSARMDTGKALHECSVYVP